MTRGWLPIALLMAMACQTLPPDMELALTRFEQGQINRARAEMGRYIREKPYNQPEVADAMQHIILIRRIKRLEAQMVSHWTAGNIPSARRSQREIRLLHPVYAESAPIFALLDLSSPLAGPGPVSAYGEWDAPPLAALSDSTLSILAPLMMEVIDAQQILAVHLARQWASTRRGVQSQGGETEMLVTRLETAYEALRGQSIKRDRREIEALAGQIDQLVQASISLSGSSDEETVLAWTAAKGDLFGRLLSLKSHLTQRSLQGTPDS
ncbi:MAG: hypothetical protein IIA59_09650 [Candidatus Marinimicrobia bacterium]|nr:hypothetical protein [Candidatus Neomarinimicrobiota bacterium]